MYTFWPRPGETCNLGILGAHLPPELIYFFWIALWSVPMALLLSGVPMQDRFILTFWSVVGVALRIALAYSLYTYAYSNNDGFSPGGDEFFYFERGLRLADGWASGSVGFSPFEIHNTVASGAWGFICFVAGHQLLFSNKLFPVISIAFLDVFSAILAYRFSLHNFESAKIGKLAFLFSIFFSHAIDVSAHLLKDSLVLFLTMATLTLAHGASRSPWARLCIVLTVFALASIRFYVGLALLGLVAVGHLAASNIKRGTRLAAVLAAAAALFVVYSYTTVGRTLDVALQDPSQALESYGGESRATAAERTHQSSHLFAGTSPKDRIIGFAHFLVSPSPLNLESLSGQLAAPGTLLWYFLMPFFFWGTWLFVRRSDLRREYLVLWAYPACIISLILFMPSINQSRHRLMIWPCAVILASVGLTRKSPMRSVAIVATWLVILATIFVRESWREAGY